MLENDVITTLKRQVLVVGDGGVGKTSLVRRFVDGKFHESYIPTIGSEFFLKKEYINVIDEDGNQCSLKIVLRIFDIGGQTEFKENMLRYAENSDVFVICYDCTNYESFNNVFQWMTELKAKVKNINCERIVITATKSDLLIDNKFQEIPKQEIDAERMKQNQVPICQLKEMANIVKTNHYIETSAKTSRNVDLLFKKVAIISYNSFIQQEIEFCDDPKKFILRNGFEPNLLSC